MVTTSGKRLITLILALIALTALALFSLAQSNEPTGPTDLTQQSSSRFNASGPQQAEAQGGNVSELSFNAKSSTKAWQGYYGNISGTIVLEDVNGNVFYNWTANEPEGEIYASTSNTVTWSSIACFNFTATGGEPNLTSEEATYGMDPADVDGIDETYNATNHDTFFVGTTQIAGCPTAYAFNETGAQTDDFQNVLLSDTTNLVFTTIIENRDPGVDTDIVGFNGVAYDFQMLVAEDEHNTSTDGPTTYFFWVEIE